MNQFSLTDKDLLLALREWDEALPRQMLLVACGGTAVTLYGHKPSTIDVDLLVPDPADYKLLVQTIKSIGYRQTTGFGYKHRAAPWKFDLFSGQTIFQTELLDPVQDPNRHVVIQRFNNVILACINPDDLVISKMFRGSSVDVEDSVVIVEKEKVDLYALAKRYKDTAGYYYNAAQCKTNLKYLINELEIKKIDATPLRELFESWNP